MAKKTHKKTGKLVTVDFTDVETRELIPEGDYHVRVEDIEQEEGDKGPYLNWELKIPSGEYKGKKLWYITSLTKQSLWNLRAVLEALGVEVPKSKMALDLPSYKGLEMGVSVEIEKYKGKEKNVVVDVWNLEDEGDESGSDEGEGSDDSGEEDAGEADTGEEGGEDSGEEEEYTGTIKEMEDDVLTVVIDDEEVDVYTEDAEVDGEPEVGATVVIKGAYDEDEDLIATEVTVKAKKTSSKKADKKKKKSRK